MRYLNTFLVMLSVSGDLYSADIVLEMKQSDSYILTCDNNTIVLDNTETFAEEFNKINSKYMHVNLVKKFDDTLVLDELSSKKICNFILNGSIDYKPNVTLHITGNAIFENIIGNNTGTVIIDSCTNDYIINLSTKKENYRKGSNITVDMKAGGQLRINDPYFTLKFVSKNN